MGFSSTFLSLYCHTSFPEQLLPHMLQLPQLDIVQLLGQSGRLQLMVSCILARHVPLFNGADTTCLNLFLFLELVFSFPQVCTHEDHFPQGET
jgi:hypothetical protein